MTRWEYARLESTERGINVAFTHRQAWTGIAPEAFFHTLGRLGDEGWELVAALPLTAALPLSAALPSTAASVPSGQPPPDARDSRDMRGPRDARSAGQGSAPAAAPSHPAPTATLQVTPDRWLVFKRPQPEPPPDQGGQGADMIKGLVGRQLLKGRLPLP